MTSDSKRLLEICDLLTECLKINKISEKDGMDALWIMAVTIMMEKANASGSVEDFIQEVFNSLE